VFELFDYQQDSIVQLRRAYAAGRQAPLLVLPTGGGKCLGKGTPVLMYDGSIKAVEHVVVGDLLMGPDSKPRKVLSTCRGREQMYRITPKKGDAYVVNASHILSLKISGSEETVTGGNGMAYRGGDIANIGVMDYLRSSKTFRHRAKGWRSGVDFATTNKLPIEPYIFGVWLGDGNSRNTQVCNIDHEVISELEGFANRTDRLSLKTFRTPNKAPIHAVSLISQKLAGRGHSNNSLLNALRI